MAALVGGASSVEELGRSEGRRRAACASCCAVGASSPIASAASDQAPGRPIPPSSPASLSTPASASSLRNSSASNPKPPHSQTRHFCTTRAPPAGLFRRTLRGGAAGLPALLLLAPFVMLAVA